MIFFEALNIFSRKSRLASCAVSLASVSAAPKTPSSSSASGTLEVVSTSELCGPVVQVEVGGGAGGGEGSSSLISSPSSSSIPRPSARHALLQCSAMPLAVPSSSHKRSSSSIPFGNSQMRRKRSSSTSNKPSPGSAVAFPSSTDAEEEGKGGPPQTAPCSEDTQPPRKRARRSATSIPSRPRSPLLLTSPPRPLPNSSSNPGTAPPTLIASSSDPPNPGPCTASASPSLPIPPLLRYQASVYHTLVLHHEYMAEKMAFGSPSSSYPFIVSPGSPESKDEILRGQDALLITRLYFVLLLSRVPIMSLPKERLERAKVALGTTLGFEEELEASTRGLGEGKSKNSLEDPWTVIGEDEGMDVDDDNADVENRSPQRAVVEADEEKVYAGPPFDSLSHMVAVMTFRHRAKMGMRTRSSRTRLRHRSSKSTSASSSKTRKRSSIKPPGGTQQGKEDVVEDEDEDEDDDGYARSTLGLVSITRAELERHIKNEDDPTMMMDIDTCCIQESAMRSTYSGDDEDDDCDIDLDSDSDEDREWRVLRGELLKGSSTTTTTTTTTTTATTTASIPIARPTSPVPSQLAAQASFSPSPPSPVPAPHLRPLPHTTTYRRPAPIRDVTNTPSAALRRPSSSSLSRSTGKTHTQQQQHGRPSRMPRSKTTSMSLKSDRTLVVVGPPLRKPVPKLHTLGHARPGVVGVEGGGGGGLSVRKRCGGVPLQ